MRTFLKVAAVLMLSFGGYYLLMGLSALMASGQIGQVAQSMDETIDPALASQATVQLGLMMLSIGMLEGLAGLFGLLGGKRRKLLIAAPAAQCYYNTIEMDKQLRVANLVREYEK